MDLFDMMTSDHVVWAGAISVEKKYGEAGFDFIDRQIDAHMHERDIKGVEMWARIGEALDRLVSPSACIH